MTIRYATALWAATLLLGLASPAGAQGNDYRLGPQDKLQIKVFDWRAGSGEVYPWTALNGEFTVAASGALSLPLLGDVPAQDVTPSQLAEAIGQKLQTKIGLQQRPDASVEVIKYRPFYILGAVDKPGEYEFRPGLSVLQAVSLAGGTQRFGADSLVGFQRDALVSRGELRSLMAERQNLLARQARLDAEVNGLAVIAWPDYIVQRAADPDISRAMREEQALFDAHRNTLKSQIDALGQTKGMLEREVTTLGAKDASLAHQLDVTKQELAQVSGLVTKGLAVLPRQLAVEQSAAAFESSRLDVQLAGLRAQQDITRTNRDSIELRAKQRTDALNDAQIVRARLATLAEQLDTTQSLIEQAEIRGPMTLASERRQRKPLFTITHKDGNAVTVGEADPVQPGDVVRVDFEHAALDRATADAGLLPAAKF